MRLARLTVWLLPASLVTFVVVAATTLRDLPALVPLRMEAGGEVTRVMEAKPFVGLIVGLVLLLTALFGLARWVLAQPAYDPAGEYSRFPRFRDRVLAVVDCTGAGGVLLIAWTASRCAAASRGEITELSRAEFLIPFLLLGGVALVGYRWAQQARRTG